MSSLHLPKSAEMKHTDNGKFFCFTMRAKHMSTQDEGRHLLDRLISVAWQTAQSHSLPEERWSPELDIQPYRRQNLLPGKNYFLAGHSYFSEYRIIGTRIETRRAGLIALVCQQKGNRYHCVPVKEALSFEGFVELLEADEQQWLDSLPDDSLIGPAYDRQGRHIPTAFAIWRTVEEESPVHVEIARR